MALTRPTFQNLNTNLATFSDPVLVSNYGNIANRDLGILFDRNTISSTSNVAVVWNESIQGFRLAYTTSTGKDAGNITITGNANLTAGNTSVTGRSTFLASNGASVIYQVYNSATNSIDTVFG